MTVQKAFIGMNTSPSIFLFFYYYIIKRKNCINTASTFPKSKLLLIQNIIPVKETFRNVSLVFLCKLGQSEQFLILREIFHLWGRINYLN